LSSVADSLTSFFYSTCSLSLFKLLR
jgi:hypothetical protein